MAQKKKKKANRPKVVSTSAASEQDVQSLSAKPETQEEKKPASASNKEASSSDKGKGKDKGKDKDKVVVKSKARAKDPRKADKKPNIFQRFVEYLKQVRLEIKRTTWPTKSEVLNMTIIVIVALIFFGAFIFLIDFVMVRLITLYGSLAPDPSTIDPSLLDLGAGDALGTDSADVESGIGG